MRLGRLRRGKRRTRREYRQRHPVHLMWRGVLLLVVVGTPSQVARAEG